MYFLLGIRTDSAKEKETEAAGERKRWKIN